MRTILFCVSANRQCDWGSFLFNSEICKLFLCNLWSRGKTKGSWRHVSRSLRTWTQYTEKHTELNRSGLNSIYSSLLPWGHAVLAPNCASLALVTTLEGQYSNGAITKERVRVFWLTVLEVEGQGASNDGGLLAGESRDITKHHKARDKECVHMSRMLHHHGV